VGEGDLRVLHEVGEFGVDEVKVTPNDPSAVAVDRHPAVVVYTDAAQTFQTLRAITVMSGYCHNSVIANVKQRSIGIVLNKLTNSSTPNVVAFDPKQRLVGDVAYSKLTMNFRNSFVAPSRYLGLTAECLRNLTNKLAYMADDTPVFEATYKGEVHSYNAHSCYDAVSLEGDCHKASKSQTSLLLTTQTLNAMLSLTLRSLMSLA
jgi:hypothetical protein